MRALAFPTKELQQLADALVGDQSKTEHDQNKTKDGQKKRFPEEQCREKSSNMSFPEKNGIVCEFPVDC